MIGKLAGFVGGMALGTAIGLGAAVLLTPQSGKDFQALLKSRREDAIASTKQEMMERERELRAELEAKKNARKIMHDALKG